MNRSNVHLARVSRKAISRPVLLDVTHAHYPVRFRPLFVSRVKLADAVREEVRWSMADEPRLGDYVDPRETKSRSSAQHMLVVGVELLKSVQASRYQVNRIASAQKNLGAKLKESLFQRMFDRTVEGKPCPYSRGLVRKYVRPHRPELRASETPLAKLAMKSSQYFDAADSRT